MTPAAGLMAAMFVGAFLVGLRSSWRLSARYRDVSELLVRRERMILASFVVVAWAITTAAGWFGLHAARRLLGFDPFDWTPGGSVIVASVVLFIPLMLDQVVARVARVKW